MNIKSNALGCLFWILFASTAFSQKYDNIWLMGYDAPFAPDDSFCISVFDFSNGNLEVGVNQEMQAFFQETNVSLCDKDGALQLYSNGVHVFNKNHQIMENGAWLIPNAPLESDLIPQGILAFYMPKDEQRVVLVHCRKQYVEAPLWTVTVTRLYYSIVDLTANNGLGKVIQKSVPFLTDTLDDGKLTAVRHGNGQDWWILANEAFSNRFYKILLNENGLSLIDTQTIGNTVLSSLGQAVFSPNGNTYAIAGSYDDEVGKFLCIYDFNRCNGELSNARQWNWHDENHGPTVGVAISPSSQFLYVPSNKYFYQFDLFADNIEASRITVAIYDGFQSPFGSKFYLAQLAPDHKIYINCSNGENVMHVIHQPDLPGLACHVEQHGIQLPCYNAQAIPNFPNYRLGDWPDSPCDTLGINPVVEPASKGWPFDLFPNPANQLATLQFHEPASEDCRIILYDLSGQVVLTEEVPAGTRQHEISLLRYPNGWYLVGVMVNGQTIARIPLVVVRT